MRDFYTPPTLTAKLQLSKKEDNQKTDPFEPECTPGRRLLALDLGAKRVGVAVSDEHWMTVRPLLTLQRRSWKELVRRVAEIVQSFDAQSLVVGLPLMMDGTDGPAATEVRRLARNFRLSLGIPVFLQDERLTSLEAEREWLRIDDLSEGEKGSVDSRAAAIILRDFIQSHPG
jgi:putative holliday junction resolvase